MGLSVILCELSLASLAAQTPVLAEVAASRQTEAKVPRHAHASASVYRLPAAPRATNMPADTQAEREVVVRSKERLPLADADLLAVQADRKQSNTSFAMRVVGLSFGLDF